MKLGCSADGGLHKDHLFIRYNPALLLGLFTKNFFIIFLVSLISIHLEIYLSLNNDGQFQSTVHMLFIIINLLITMWFKTAFTFYYFFILYMFSLLCNLIFCIRVSLCGFNSFHCNSINYSKL